MGLSKHSHQNLIAGLVAKTDYDWMSGKTYQWFAEVLRPSVRKMCHPNSQPRDRTMTARALVMLGDILDLFFDAPKAAYRNYSESLRYDPACAYAWREKGAMLEAMGDFTAAQRAFQRALRIDPDDEGIASDIEYVHRKIKESMNPLYDNSDSVWLASEWIARVCPSKAIRVLERKTSVRALQCRIRAFEALGNPEAALREWARIATHSDAVAVEQPDWFFMSSETWNSESFWRSVLAIGTRLNGGMYPRDDSFPNLKSDKDRVLKNSRAYERYVSRRWKLSAELHLARIRKDERSCLRMLRRYPKWKRARNVLEELRKGMGNIQSSRMR